MPCIFVWSSWKPLTLSNAIPQRLFWMLSRNCLFSLSNQLAVSSQRLVLMSTEEVLEDSKSLAEQQVRGWITIVVSLKKRYPTHMDTDRDLLLCSMFLLFRLRMMQSWLWLRGKVIPHISCWFITRTSRVYTSCWTSSNHRFFLKFIDLYWGCWNSPLERLAISECDLILSCADDNEFEVVDIAQPTDFSISWRVSLTLYQENLLNIRNILLKHKGGVGIALEVCLSLSLFVTNNCCK